jgi:hypothetical protein
MSGHVPYRGTVSQGLHWVSVDEHRLSKWSKQTNGGRWLYVGLESGHDVKRAEVQLNKPFVCQRMALCGIRDERLGGCASRRC